MVCGFYHNAVWRESHSLVSLSVHSAYSILLRTPTYVSERRRNGPNLRSFHRRNDLCYTPLQRIVTQARLDNTLCGLSYGDSTFQCKHVTFCRSLSLSFVFIVTKGSIGFGEVSSGFLRITLWTMGLFSFMRYFQFYTCNIYLPSVP